MAGTQSPTQKKFQVTGKHTAIYEAYYAYVDPNGHGTIGAMEAARFLKKSGLSDVVLSRVWDLSDPGGRGCLDKTGIFVALKLVALAQAGRDLNMSNITLDMPPPNMGDVPIVVPKKPPPPPSSTAFTTTLPSSTVDWTINAAEREKYNKTFDSLQPVNGVIPGNKVKGVLMESKLPIETLGQIWELADQDKDGSLNRGEFIAAMHLVYKALEKHAIPIVLPPELIATSIICKNSNTLMRDSALPKMPPQPSAPPIPILPQMRPLPPSKPPPISNILTDSTNTTRKDSVINTSVGRNAVLLSGLESTSVTTGKMPVGCGSIAADNMNWVVTVEEREKSDMLFVKSDIDRDGFVSGMEIKDVFLQSGVPQSILAHIWALCDIRQSGKLNSEQFALAMWLVAKCLQGIDPPATLTPDMIPPSFRTANDKPQSIENNNSCFSNPELEMISKDIEELTREKLSLEMDISQKEASIRIKSGEIKNLQSELDTLAATLKQLENQKGEAHKRLGDLKSQVQKLCTQASEQADVISAEEAELLSRKEQLESLKQEEQRLERLKKENGVKLDGLGTKLQDSQLNISQTKALISQLEEQTKQMNDAITACNSAIESGDASNVADATLHLNPDFRDSQFSRLGNIKNQTNENGFDEKENYPYIENIKTTSEYSIDPFTNDNFKSSSNACESNDRFTSAFSNSTDQFAQDPFNEFSSDSTVKKDPFDAFGDSNNTSITPEPNKDAFGCDPFAVLHAPTRDGALGRSTSPSPALPPKKSKPPRPAPPRPMPPSLNRGPGATDQFGSGSAAGGGFADFANFEDKFSSTTTPGMSSSTSNACVSESTPRLEFTDDPFRDYRYEDPSNIAFEEEAKFESEQLAAAKTATGRQSAPLHNVLMSSGISKQLNSSSGRASVPPNFEDERFDSTWISNDDLQMMQQRRVQMIKQEEEDLKLAIALSKEFNK